MLRLPSFLAKLLYLRSVMIASIQRQAANEGRQGGMSWDRGKFVGQECRLICRTRTHLVRARYTLAS